jgi:phosphoribosylanthranilate isomerase
MATAIKICGITRIEDALAAAQCGVHAIGLVFYAPSPRHVSPVQAAAIIAALPPFVTTVGLFVDAEACAVRNTLALVRLDLLQFHGAETPQYCRAFGVPYMKALRVRPGMDLLQYAEDYIDAKALLLDAYVEGMAGGTGATFDWSLIPPSLPLPIVLSGGLTPNNVADAIRAVKPWAVDVSSGVESSSLDRKRIKDAAKIAAFVSEVHGAQITDV